VSYSSPQVLPNTPAGGCKSFRPTTSHKPRELQQQRKGDLHMIYTGARNEGRAVTTAAPAAAAYSK
jgi:hypothetical protein